jgi:hypothetical protein
MMKCIIFVLGLVVVGCHIVTVKGRRSITETSLGDEKPVIGPD